MIVDSWAVLGAPTGKRLAPVMGEVVARCAASVSSTSPAKWLRRWW